MTKTPRTRKIRLALDEAAIELLAELAGGERKRGKYVSQLIYDQAARERQAKIARLKAELEQLEQPPDGAEGQ